MNIELTCNENESFKLSVNVYQLNFDDENKRFWMPLCIGDDWLQRVNCLLDVLPTSIRLEKGQGYLHFKCYKDAADFGAWLIEGDAKVQHGFRTMRG